jgi:hypothetical protein
MISYKLKQEGKVVDDGINIAPDLVANVDIVIGTYTDVSMLMWY